MRLSFCLISLFIPIVLIYAAKKDYYKILGIKKNAMTPEIKQAFRKWTMEYHPDRCSKEQKTCLKKFLEITEARDVLTDSEKRRQHDLYGQTYSNGPDDSDTYEDVYRKFEKDFKLRREQRKNEEQRNRNDGCTPCFFDRFMNTLYDAWTYVFDFGDEFAKFVNSEEFWDYVDEFWKTFSSWFCLAFKYLGISRVLEAVGISSGPCRIKYQKENRMDYYNGKKQYEPNRDQRWRQWFTEWDMTCFGDKFWQTMTVMTEWAKDGWQKVYANCCDHLSVFCKNVRESGWKILTSWARWVSGSWLTGLLNCLNYVWAFGKNVLNFFWRNLVSFFLWVFGDILILLALFFSLLLLLSLSSFINAIRNAMNRVVLPFFVCCLTWYLYNYISKLFI